MKKNSLPKTQLRLQAEAALAQYTDLYDFAPVGYFTLARDGTIHRANLAGANLLGVERSGLIDRRFEIFVPDQSRVNFNTFLEKVFESQRNETCEVELQKSGSDLLWVRIDANRPRASHGQVEKCHAVVSDITKYKRAEQALRESEIRYRLVADNTHDWEFWSDPAGQFISISPSCERMTGYTADQFMADPNLLTQIIHPDDLPGYERHRRQGTESPAAGKVEFRVIRPDGDWRWIEQVSQPIFNGEGRFLGMRGSNRDITENKRVENLLQVRFRLTKFAAGHSLDELLQNALDELCALTDSPIGFFHFVEPDQHKLSIQAWSPRTLEDLCIAEGQGHHDNLDQAGVWADCVREGRPVRHNDYASLQHRQGLPEGHVPMIREMVFPIFRNQKIVAIIGVGNKSRNYTEDDLAYASRLTDLIWDITDRRQTDEALRESEARYRSILEDQTELICRYLPDGRLSYVNEAYARYYGETAQKLINTNFLPQIPEPDLLMVINKISEITPQEPMIVYEHRIIKQDGEILWQHWTHRGIYNTAGELIEHQAVGNDITKRKRAEEGLNRYLSELKVLYDNGLAISALQEPREIGRKIIETLSSNLSWHHIVIRLRRGETEYLDLIAFNQPNLNGQEVVEVEKRFNALIWKIGQGLSGWSVQTGQVIRSGNVQSHPQYINTYSGIRSGVYMPLIVGERTIGCISVESEEEEAFTEQDERLLATLAAQTAIAFENARLYQNIQQELQDRKRAEEALRESEERFRLAIQATKDGLWEWNIQTNQEFFSPRWCEIIGYSFDDPELAHTYNSWAERIHPEDSERVMGALNDHLEKGTMYAIDYRHRHKSGEYRWQNVSGQAIFDERGKPTKLVGCISDITERKRVEEALRMAEADYRAIFERAPVGIFRSTVDGHFLKANQALAEMYGYHRPEELIDEIESIAMQIYLDSSSRQKFQDLLAEDGEVQGFTVQNKRKDGSMFWISMNAHAVKNETGQILYYEGFIEDITERKLAEEQIQLLAKLPAEDPNPVLRVAQEGTLLYINEAGLRLLSHWNLQVGKTVPPMLQEAVSQSMQNGKTQTLDLEYSDRLYAFYVAPIISSGYANLYGHDITESRQAKALRDAEARYHALFEQSPYGVLLVDTETGNAIEANDVASRQLGYTREEFAALKISDYAATEDTKQVAQHMQKIEREGSDNFETLHRTKSGENRNIHVWVKRLYLGNRNCFYTIYQDITERKRMEEANEAYSREITLLEERQRIASELHDSVSQTLFSARLTAEMLLLRPDRQTETFSRSLLDLHRLVRSASGEIRLILVELRTNALLNASLDTLLANLIDSGMARTNANLIFQCLVENLVLPAKIKLAFYRIAQEATSNAIKHGKPDNIQCILRDNEQVLEMLIQDDGIGFSEDKVSDDHFGLQIMRERAEQAGLKLAITGQPGKGTSVTVCWEKE